MKCVCRQFTRGTTPSITFNMGVPLDDALELYVTFKQLDTLIVEKRIDDIIIVDQNTIKIILTEKESLLFSDKYDVECQFMVKYTNGAIVVSQPLIFNVNKVLHEVHNEL